jgi:CubicO group peptidase (beta-lactamase class C family)
VEIAAHAPSPRIWSYTNAGWCLLGRVVEAVSGTTFEKAAREHLGSAGVRGISFATWCLGWARFDWSNGPVWGWDGMINGERALLRLLPDLQTAVVLLANASSGRALAGTLLPELMEATHGIRLPAWRPAPTGAAAGDLSRFAGAYTWPDRRIDVSVAGEGLRITEGDREALARPLDDRTFLLDPEDADGPTDTFGVLADDGRPGVLYYYVWAVPRSDQAHP